MSTPTQRMFKKEEAARYLGISDTKLVELTDLGKIPAKNFLGRRAYLLEDLDAYIQSLEQWTPQKMRNHQV